MNKPKLTYDHLAVFGLNHWNTPVSVREKFSFNQEKCVSFLNKAFTLGFTDVLLVSTCNRSEVLVFNDDPAQIRDLFIQQAKGTARQFADYGYMLHGQEAAEHFFKVAVGLDSQILGDLQIIKQVKEAYELSHQQKMAGKVLHRFIQCAFKAHKRSRRETGLATGAATTAYAAVQCARHHIQSLEDKKIVLVGTGKIGKITCKNLMSYGARNVTLVNRSKNKAERLGAEFNLPVAEFDQIGDLLPDADLVIVATGADYPVISENIFPKNLNGKPRIMLDLSVPRNIDPALDDRPGIRIINMDMLEDMTDEANRRRREYIPLVETIIRDEITDFRNWLGEQQIIPVIKSLKAKLEAVRQSELKRFQRRNGNMDYDKADQVTRRIMKKILAYSITYIKENQDEPEEISRVIRSIFKLGQKSVV